MKKTIVIFGATGQQGGSVIQSILHDPHLSTTYHIRAITRTPSHPSAQALQCNGIEIIPADANNPASLLRALANSYMVFAMTLPEFSAPNAKQTEIAQGKAIADAAVACGTEYIIFSTLPHVSRISHGKYTRVEYFDAKAEVEEYIRGLPIKSVFYLPGWFLQNFKGNMRVKRMGEEGGGLVLGSVVGPGTRLPVIDPSRDTGRFLGGALREPEKWVGRVVKAAVEIWSYEEVARVMGEVLGEGKEEEEVEYRVVEREGFTEGLSPVFADRLIEMLRFIEEFGYFGLGEEEEAEVVRMEVEGVEEREKLTGLREFLGREGVE
ncbi:hypothetical protein ASPCADRAFT_164647 [Aspergillus carbonarius ITEM 5010]|uniref:NmrA-like domain-containing protein n=1 Tax=Aspergillus carbonarius (strain ITEM 5010) TaxID=602072 RepID=A0A1R3RUU9_ASPC5|nr:hypothetical protein ASPCADRAFT_164647 [Aspergillus carbonarius ITEM 5010]